LFGEVKPDVIQFDIGSVGNAMRRQPGRKAGVNGLPDEYCLVGNPV
jgi:hypothetical protein